MSVDAGCAQTWSTAAIVIVGALMLLAGRRFRRRVVTLRATALAPIVARRLSRWVRTRSYNDDEFFAADGAGTPLIERRREALDRLAQRFRERTHQTSACGAQLRDGFSDLRFTDANRVPFPFARVIRERFDLTSMVTESDGPRLKDVDGGWSLDVSGSYGLNVAGFDRYKQWIERGWARVRDLGPVLGPLHPVVAENVAILKGISQLDEVSFHMSGTEAVMAAVRVARFNTRRRLIVCFAGAYHGWWDGVVAGLGSERDLDDCLTLKDVSPASLEVLRARRHEIAGVLVNPVQSFHPNAPPPNDAVLLTSEVRHTSESTQRYERWLHELRVTCSECGIPLIFDEVYTGFRLAPGGAQEYFGVRADVVVYGKTVAGGLPIGVICGSRRLMRRFDPERPMRLAYVVGTFSAHPAVMGAMNEFLRWVTDRDSEARYRGMNAQCDAWVRSTNQSLAAHALPVRIVHLGTIWTVLFSQPGRYNWLLQYYLRAHGIALSWVGTGRCLCSMDFTHEHYAALHDAVVAAASEMKRDGWWPSAIEHPGRDKQMRERLRREMIGSLVHVPAPLQAFYSEVMRRKEDDHHASHNNKANQFLHLISSSVFLFCYAMLFRNLTLAMSLGLAALFLRQFGHAVLEPPCHDKEETLLGYSTRNKTMIFLGYTLIPVVHLARAGGVSVDASMSVMPAVAGQWWMWTWIVVLGRVAYLVWAHSTRASMVWYVKLVTDPLTDIATYFPRRRQRA